MSPKSPIHAILIGAGQRGADAYGDRQLVVEQVQQPDSADPGLA